MIADKRGHAEAEIHVRPVGDVARHAGGHLVACVAPEGHRITRRAVHAPRDAGVRHDERDEDAGRDDCLGVERTQRHDLAHLRDCASRRRGHERAEVARGFPVDEIAPPVAAVGADQRDVTVQRVLKDLRAPVDDTSLLVSREVGSAGGRRIERADAGPGRANALGKRTLRHELELDPAGAEQAFERVRVLVPRVRAHEPAHAPEGDEPGEPGVAVAGMVADDREVARALRNQRVDELRRDTRGAEAANHRRRAVVNVGDCLLGGGGDLVDHRAVSRGHRRPVRRRPVISRN